MNSHRISWFPLLLPFPEPYLLCIISSYLCAPATRVPKGFLFLHCTSGTSWNFPGNKRFSECIPNPHARSDPRLKGLRCIYFEPLGVPLDRASRRFLAALNTNGDQGEKKKKKKKLKGEENDSSVGVLFWIMFSLFLYERLQRNPYSFTSHSLNIVREKLFKEAIYSKQLNLDSFYFS